jgi:hypothetical protein
MEEALALSDDEDEDGDDGREEIQSVMDICPGSRVLQ